MHCFIVASWSAYDFGSSQAVLTKHCARAVGIEVDKDLYTTAFKARADLVAKRPAMEQQIMKAEFVKACFLILASA